MKKALSTITLAILGLILMAGLAHARKVVVLSPEEIASGVQRAVSGVPKLRAAMKDPDSFVLESVHLKAPNKQGISDICYSYRAHNSYGGYSGTGTARLNSKGIVDAFGSSTDDEIAQAMNSCSQLVQSMTLDITAQVKSALAPTAPVADSPAEQAKQAQAYADCLKLAVDNPKIVCKQ
ncbi:MAG: hypothetical protein WBQ43_02780 [Terriglobales bacterium]